MQQKIFTCSVEWIKPYLGPPLRLLSGAPYRTKLLSVLFSCLDQHDKTFAMNLKCVFFRLNKSNFGAPFLGPVAQTYRMRPGSNPFSMASGPNGDIPIHKQSVFGRMIKSCQLLVYSSNWPMKLLRGEIFFLSLLMWFLNDKVPSSVTPN